nr:MAG TPA: hypothetical protein [Caudoviricetes sp.]
MRGSITKPHQRITIYEKAPHTNVHEAKIKLKT